MSNALMNKSHFVVVCVRNLVQQLDSLVVVTKIRKCARSEGRGAEREIKKSPNYINEV